MKSLLILGRQPAIGLAEIESLYSDDKLHRVNNQAVIVDVDPCLLAFDRLGGSVKFAKLLSELPTTNFSEVIDFLLEQSPKHALNMPKGKMLLGLSAYGFELKPKELLKSAIRLKNAIRSTGRSVRVVPNKTLELNSAQVIHNKLTSTNGWELLLINSGQQTFIAQTVKVQDIEAYAKRDQARPYRDPSVGMLPPKLAQIIINLTVGSLPPEAQQSICEIPPDEPIPKTHFIGSLILDPFCGSGVILQEAAVMGYDCEGSDISNRMVEYATKNTEWLRSLPNSPLSKAVQVTFEVADATRHHWQNQPKFIASETYLGPNFAIQPSEHELKQAISKCNQLIEDFLINIAKQIGPGTRLCLAIPAWLMSNKAIRHLPLIDSLETIGYNRLSFKYVSNEQLVYYRPNQIVARELLVLIRK